MPEKRGAMMMAHLTTDERTSPASRGYVDEGPASSYSTQRRERSRWLHRKRNKTVRIAVRVCNHSAFVLQVVQHRSCRTGDVVREKVLPPISSRGFYTHHTAPHRASSHQSGAARTRAETRTRHGTLTFIPNRHRHTHHVRHRPRFRRRQSSRMMMSGFHSHRHAHLVPPSDRSYRSFNRRDSGGQMKTGVHHQRPPPLSPHSVPRIKT
ncbi:hypothetical protein HDK90DRAFT_86064 [Phyllosticta capitalensis]|uniref:Uncharacterized protein n=1 Tax=Phyllosticta capitalensis TaxID=121624 RepID=A0ABR1YCC2_9PEZI